MSVTPVFDQLAVEWSEEGLPLPFKLVVIPDISAEGEQAELDDKLGTLPLWESWEASFHGEYLDFGASGPHVIVHERQTLAQPDQNTGPELPSGDLSTDALAELEELLAHDLTDAAIIHLFHVSEVNFDEWDVAEMIERWDWATEYLAENSEDEPTARQVMAHVEQRRIEKLNDKMQDKLNCRKRGPGATKKAPSLIKKATQSE